ncbi:MAG: hypothetical protein H7338_04825 [Candidatus Sericytochromatia bacterium]|nr:hypothetical protein [Candidatus Sericytochromatia bacterium]
MAMDAGRFTRTVIGLALLTAVLPGCGRDVPVAFHQAVSPCIEMPKLLGFDGSSALQAMLAVDLAQKDADGDGSVTLKEAKAKTAKPNLIDEALFNAVNPKDGKMSKADMKAAGSTLFKWASFYKLKLLNRFDLNQDHGLSIDEVKGYFNIDQAAFDEADAKPKEAKSPVSAEDVPGNGDKSLNADEFLGLVLHQNQTNCAPADAAPPAAAAANLRRNGPATQPVRRPTSPAPMYRR